MLGTGEQGRGKAVGCLCRQHSCRPDESCLRPIRMQPSRGLEAFARCGAGGAWRDWVSACSGNLSCLWLLTQCSMVRVQAFSARRGDVFERVGEGSAAGVGATISGGDGEDGHEDLATHRVSWPDLLFVPEPCGGRGVLAMMLNRLETVGCPECDSACEVSLPPPT